MLTADPHADCSGDSQAGLKWLKKAGYDIPAEARLEYDQKLHYVTITFSVPKEVRERLPIPPEDPSTVSSYPVGNGKYKGRVDISTGGSGCAYDEAGWLYTYVPHPALSSAGFVLGRMDNDTSMSFLPPYRSLSC